MIGAAGDVAGVRFGVAIDLVRSRPVHVVLERVAVSNGLEWSPDGTSVYYDDTATLQVVAFDYDRDSG